MNKGALHPRSPYEATAPITLALVCRYQTVSKQWQQNFSKQ